MNFLGFIKQHNDEGNCSLQFGGMKMGKCIRFRRIGISAQYWSSNQSYFDTTRIIAEKNKKHHKLIGELDQGCNVYKLVNKTYLLPLQSLDLTGEVKSGILN